MLGPVAAACYLSAWTIEGVDTVVDAARHATAPRPQDPEDAIEDTPVVHAGNAARFVRENRFDDAPFAVVEFIAHDSTLHTGACMLRIRDQWPNSRSAVGG